MTAEVISRKKETSSKNRASSSRKYDPDVWNKLPSWAQKLLSAMGDECRSEGEAEEAVKQTNNESF